MKKKFLLLGMASVFALTGCHGTKKVEFKEFGEEVKKLADVEFTVKEVKVSGKVEDEKFKAFTVNIEAVEKGEEPELDDTQKKAFVVGSAAASVGLVYTALAVAYGLAGEDAIKGMTFYVGNGFKIKSEKEEVKSSAEYDKRGMLVSYKSTNKDKKVTQLSLRWKVEDKK